jgi:hypothetical protein
LGNERSAAVRREAPGEAVAAAGSSSVEFENHVAARNLYADGFAMDRNGAIAMG